MDTITKLIGDIAKIALTTLGFAVAVMIACFPTVYLFDLVARRFVSETTVKITSIRASYSPARIFYFAAESLQTRRLMFLVVLSITWSIAIFFIDFFSGAIWNHSLIAANGMWFDFSNELVNEIIPSEHYFIGFLIWCPLFFAPTTILVCFITYLQSAGMTEEVEATQQAREDKWAAERAERDSAIAAKQKIADDAAEWVRKSNEWKFGKPKE